MDDNNLTFEEWKQQKRDKKARFTAMQNLPYDIKVKRAEIRAKEFYRCCTDPESGEKFGR